MKHKKRNKKSDKNIPFEKIVLITATIDLLKELVDLAIKLIDELP